MPLAHLRLPQPLLQQAAAAPADQEAPPAPPLAAQPPALLHLPPLRRLEGLALLLATALMWVSGWTGWGVWTP